jgi:polyferredoxin
LSKTDNPQARRLRNSRRRALVLGGVQLLLLAHIAHWIITGSSVAPLEPSEAISFSRNNVITPGLIVLGVAVLSTLIFGRFFCGWACHLLALQDACAWLLRKLKIRVRPLRSRVLRLVPVLAFIWMFLVPLYARLTMSAAQPSLSTEWTTSSFWETFPSATVSIITFVVAGCYVIYLLGNKAYCLYACPYGAILGASDTFSVGRIVVDDNKCNSCMECTKACSSNVIVHQEIKEFGAVVDSNCMKTLDCVASCPNQALSFTIAMPTVMRQSRPVPDSKMHALSISEEAVLAGGFIFGFFSTHDLFGAVPFLLALGFGLVAAHGALLIWRKKISVSKSKIKFGALLLGLMFFMHAAVVQSQALQRDHYFNQTFDLRMAYLRGEIEVPLKAESLQVFLNADKYAATTSAISYAGYERNINVHGWRQLMSGDRPGFEAAMRAILLIRPGFGEVMFQLGIHYWVSGKEQLAIEIMQEITADDAKYSTAQQYIEKINTHGLEH